MKVETHFQHETTTFNKLKNGEWFVLKDDPHAIHLKLDSNRYYILSSKGDFEIEIINDTNEIVMPLQYELPAYNTVYYHFNDLQSGDMFLTVDNYGSPSLRVKLDELRAYNFQNHLIYEIDSDTHVENIVSNDNLLVTFHLKEGE